VRQAEAKQCLERMHAWFTANLRRVSGRSDMRIPTKSAGDSGLKSATHSD
jgi:hypothetical protein